MQFTASLIAALAAFAPLASASVLVPEGAADGFYAAETTVDGTVTELKFTAVGTETAVEITGAELEKFKADSAEKRDSHPHHITKRGVTCDGGNCKSSPSRPFLLFL